MAATNVHGLLGGLVAISDPQWVKVKEFSFFVGILLASHIRGLMGRINILNVYAPYHNQDILCDHLIESELLDLSSLIIAGDLNCTIDFNEIWGCTRRVNVMANHIKDIILEHNLVDICPSSLIPSWDNRRLGKRYIAKQLNCFILHEQIIERLGMVSYEVISYHISQHMPTSLR